MNRNCITSLKWIGKAFQLKRFKHWLTQSLNCTNCPNTSISYTDNRNDVNLNSQLINKSNQSISLSNFIRNNTDHTFLTCNAMLARYMLSLCFLSVWQSQAGTVPKRRNVDWRKQLHTIADGLYFLDAKDLGEIPMWSPPTGAPNKGGVASNRRHSTNISLYLRNCAR